ncbi:agamous-like MADS-box protein AGL80 [Brachypodium distachyon]|uniref:agamous-like MADS-box protein AGL80 n=1 Tax=Brachypodium distachyon TaxID=15368 RepID=UPI0005300291|nr:agamous-like MADS-box protein AGL80 [Brachypodium distachyon]|eukprot:XP_024314493.1 agamous-like MADS-box protein AGL80 [Brachypodium distachyon]
MGRKKVSLQRIPNDAARRATFRNRHDVLVKKASELSTLCNIKACVIVYGEGEAQPEVWSFVDEVVPILHRYKAMPEIGQCKKTVTQEDFLRQRIDKLKRQVHKAVQENRELDTACLVHKAMLGHLPRLEGLTVEEAANVGHQETWLNKVRPPQVHSGFTGGNNATSSMAHNNMASTNASGGFSRQCHAGTGNSSSSFHHM